MEQPVHEIRAFEQIAHEEEQRHRRELGGLERLQHLEVHQVDDEIAEADQTEDHREDDQGEGDREAEDDGDEQRPHQHEAQHLVAQGHLPVLAAWTARTSSASPWIRSSTALTGTTVFNG